MKLTDDTKIMLPGYEGVSTAVFELVNAGWTMNSISTMLNSKDSGWHIMNDKPEDNGESSGGSVDYYKCPISNETTVGLQENLPEGVKYIAECNDMIEALDLTYAEANIFKEVWRSAAARTLGKKKAGHTELRGAEKIVFFSKRNLIQKGGK